MDFLDSLDLETSLKKAHQVQSWYLFEQYKSLERNQLAATQKLKNRSYQEKILYRELSERRSRRRLYDQIGLSHSDCHMRKTTLSDGSKTPISLSTEDLFQSFCEIQEPEFEMNIDDEIEMEEVIQQRIETCDDFKSLDDIADDERDSEAEGVGSMVKNHSYDNLADDIKEELKLVKKNIADNLNFQLETVKENIQELERCTLEFDDSASEGHSVVSYDESMQEPDVVQNKEKFIKKDLTPWAKLVSFAYQLMKLNHGNCFNNYGSQVSTAVLACDILLRGISMMCDSLQPYVCPIKFSTDDEETPTSKNIKQKNVENNTKTDRRKLCKQINQRVQTKTVVNDFKLKYRSENLWQHRPKPANVGRTKYLRRASEPWRSVARLSLDRKTRKSNETSSSSCWPCKCRSCWPCKCSNCWPCKCGCIHPKVSNPMLKLVKYLDRFI